MLAIDIEYLLCSFFSLYLTGIALTAVYGHLLRLNLMVKHENTDICENTDILEIQWPIFLAVFIYSHALFLTRKNKTK